MSKVTIVQVIYNSKRFIKPVFEAIFNQTFKDFEVVAIINGNSDGGKEFLEKEFPRVKIIDPGYNMGFAKGHNLVFAQSTSEFFQLVNPDMVMEPKYIEEMLKAFKDEKVGAATGKLYRCEFSVGADTIRPNGGRLVAAPTVAKTIVIDTTGVTISKSGWARDRGQHEEDSGQYDNQVLVQAVSGAGAMYSAKALETIKLPRIMNQESRIRKDLTYNLQLTTDFEYFDEDFHSYWEDVDLAWRITKKGFKCAFVPSAIGYHGRGAASSVGGYKKVWSFIKFHRALPSRIRQLNYKNHILMYIKNSPKFYLQFFVREFFMFFYILFFEISTLKVLPQLIKLIPIAFKKRRF